jgi:hypothetical protein
MIYKLTTKETENVIPLNQKIMDMIFTKILKVSFPSVILLLKHFCNTALTNGIFRDRLKFSLIEPPYKNGSKIDMKNYVPNYIPISLWKGF